MITRARVFQDPFQSSSLGFCIRRFSGTSAIKRPQPVIVVRHGETDFNKALRVQGSTDIHLNEKGLAQAKASAQALVKLWKSKNYQTPSMVFSSPLARAKETANAAAAALSCPAGVATVAGLREWNLGKVEGLTKEQAMQDFPEDWRVFSQWANPETPIEDARSPLSQGESMEQVRWRVVEAINDLARQNHSDGDNSLPIICVTHGGVLGQLLRHVVQTQSGDAEPVKYHRPGNACMSHFLLDFEDEAASDSLPQWTIETWADTVHLTGDLAPIGADYDKKQAR